MAATQDIVLDRVSLSVFHAAHREVTRYAMNGVLVDEKGFTATNGKVLCHVTHNGAVGAGVAPFVIPLATVKDLNRAIGAGKKAKPFVLELGPLPAEGKATRTGETRDIRPVDGFFPPYEDVLPTDRDSRDDVGLNAQLMIDLLKAAQAFAGTKDVVLRMNVKDAKAGVIFKATSGGREFTGIQMPVDLGLVKP